MDLQDWIDIRGLRIPACQNLLSVQRQRDLEDAGRNEGIARRLVSIAKSDDKALVFGAGIGLLPALLAGRVGMRHVHIIEPDPALRDHLRQLLALNGLFRVTLSDSLPCPFEPSLLVYDLTESEGRFVKGALAPSLRGALLRITGTWNCAVDVMPRLPEAGLHYFARQSRGDVICFLRKWN